MVMDLLKKTGCLMLAGIAMLLTAFAILFSTTVFQYAGPYGLGCQPIMRNMYPFYAAAGVGFAALASAGIEWAGFKRRIFAVTAWRITVGLLIAAVVAVVCVWTLTPACPFLTR